MDGIFGWLGDHGAHQDLIRHMGDAARLSQESTPHTHSTPQLGVAAASRFGKAVLHVENGLAVALNGRPRFLDDDLSADLYEDICLFAEKAGYQQYEISNFARNGRFALHNLKYWQDQLFIGFGPGAHGMTGRGRYANLDNLEDYEQAIGEDRLPFQLFTEMTPMTRFKDALIMGLRLVRGIDLDSFGRRYQVDAKAFVMETIGDLQPAGLFVVDRDNVFLTRRGRLLSNVVFSRWV